MFHDFDRLERFKALIRKTEDKIILIDNDDPEDAFVLMSLSDYEDLVSDYDSCFDPMGPHFFDDEDDDDFKILDDFPGMEEIKEMDMEEESQSLPEDLPMWDDTKAEPISHPVRGQTTVKEFEAEGLPGVEPEVVNLGEVEAKSGDDKYFFEEVDEENKE